MATTKTEIAAYLARQIHNLTKVKAEEILTETFNFIASEVRAGQKVTVHLFGTFERKERAARDGRNPATGQKIKIAAKRVPHFSPTPTFKNSL